MIAITKNEAKIVREQFPGLHIRRTVNKYYIEENYKVMQFLKSLGRGERIGRNA